LVNAATGFITCPVKLLLPGIFFLLNQKLEVSITIGLMTGISAMQVFYPAINLYPTPLIVMISSEGSSFK
jgi:hypothetical protein